MTFIDWSSDVCSSDLWYAIRPAKDGFANFLRKILPEKLAYNITRFKNVKLQDVVFKKARDKPQKVKDFLTKKVKAALGDRYDAEAFTPPYNPWDIGRATCRERV